MRDEEIMFTIILVHQHRNHFKKTLKPMIKLIEVMRFMLGYQILNKLS